jgi:YbbR domain-containing protein
VVLATLLYAGFVLSENTRTFDDPVLIAVRNQPTNQFLQLGEENVTSIRYFVPEGARPNIDSSSWDVWIDLDERRQVGGRTLVPVRVEAKDPRVEVLEFEPPEVTVQIEQVQTRVVEVFVDMGTIPDNLDVRDPFIANPRVEVRGPESQLQQVSRVVARVRIEPSGLNVEREVELIPVDGRDERVPSVDVEPETTTVRIAVFTDRQTKPVPVNPIITGEPAVGFAIDRVTVDPLVIQVEGDAAELATLTTADTAPISIADRTANLSVQAQLALPTGILPVGDPTIRVTIALRPVTESRTLNAGIVLEGAESDSSYTLSTDRVLVTLGGSPSALDQISAGPVTVAADVTGLQPGSHEVPIRAELPNGVTLVTASPERITVTIFAPPSPSPGVSPAASPGISPVGSPALAPATGATPGSPGIVAPTASPGLTLGPPP